MSRFSQRVSCVERGDQNVLTERDADRLYVTYRIGAADVASAIQAIRVEQTIEFPYDLAPEWIQETIVGRIEAVDADTVELSYDPRILDSDGGITQLINVIWGNVSLISNVRVVAIDPPRDFVDALPGPRFGLDGTHELVGAGATPLLMTAIKPMGTSAADLASHAALLADAGIDIIKDDHGLANQPWAPWHERVSRCSAAVMEVNARTDRCALYAASLNVPLDRAIERAHEAKELGAGALLVLPGVSSFELLRVLAADDSLALPLIAHPAALGSFTVNPAHGFEPGLIYGLLNRLAGADLCVFVNHGGRFGPSAHQCQRIRDECLRPLHSLARSVPVAGGGMSIERLPDLFKMYGSDAAYLVGGALYRGDLRTNADALRAAVDNLLESSKSLGEGDILGAP